MSHHVEELEKVQMVLGSWLATTVRHRYNSAILDEVNELAITTTCLISSIPLRTVEDDPECTFVDNLADQISNISKKFEECKTIIKQVAEPSKLLKRTASGSSDEHHDAELGGDVEDELGGDDEMAKKKRARDDTALDDSIE
jgi:hypothetical protein